MIKNIYIIWTERLNIQQGGVHRIIHILLEKLPKYGYDVQYLYTEDNYRTFHHYKSLKEDSAIPVGELKQWLSEHHCDLIIGQDGVFSHVLSDIIQSWGDIRIKYITEFHNSVLLLEKTFSRHYWKWLFYRSKGTTCVKALAQLVLYPLMKHRCRQSIRRNIQLNLIATRIVLLSARELPIIEKLVPEAAGACDVINNPLSWEDICKENILQSKKKEVLIVSRLYNPEKRIDRALYIWQMLEQRGLTDWQLRIVGAGVHEQYLKDLVQKLGLKQVSFEGRQESRPFYLDAALFMMTSAVEGWGLTLTESMQSGVVPIAFDSYPALHDIITDQYDGCIIPDNDLEAYANCMEELMCNRSKRERIARNGLTSCRRFEIDKIVQKWCKLIESL